MTNSEAKKFQIAKYWADNKLSEQKAYIFDEKRIWKQLNRKGLGDAQVLFKMMLKEINNHNAKIQKKKTLLDNLRWKGINTFRSKVFSGLSLPLKTIDKLIKENPDKDSYEIYKLLVR